MLRPKNPKKFFKSFNIDFYNFHSNMTNGAILSFKSNKILKNQLKKLKKLIYMAINCLKQKSLKNYQVFCRVQIRSKKNYFTKNSKKDMFYENNQKLLKNNIDSNFLKFNRDITFIKTTSKHIPEGQLFYRFINIKKNKIENIEIYKLIRDYFK